MKTYSDKLKDPRWQRKRLEIMQRDDFQCAICCEATETLNVHHRYYVSGRLPWEYPSWAFRTLCKNCHNESHEMKTRREEGAQIPLEDAFETIFGFLGAGVDFDESYIWDLGVEVSMLSSIMGQNKAIGSILGFTSNLRSTLQREAELPPWEKPITP